MHRLRWIFQDQAGMVDPQHNLPEQQQAKFVNRRNDQRESQVHTHRSSNPNWEDALDGDNFAQKDIDGEEIEGAGLWEAIDWQCACGLSQVCQTRNLQWHGFVGSGSIENKHQWVFGMDDTWGCYGQI